MHLHLNGIEVFLSFDLLVSISLRFVGKCYIGLIQEFRDLGLLDILRWLIIHERKMLHKCKKTT